MDAVEEIAKDMQMSSEEDSSDSDSEEMQTQTPSQEDYSDWIYAENKTTQNNRKSVNSGKWLIFEKPSKIDESWNIIMTATESGKLGGAAKVSTKKTNDERRYDAFEHGLYYNRSRRYNDSVSDYVICIYTYDWTDEEDVMRVREELKKLGFERKLPYKSDEDTNAGMYSYTTRQKISKYYC